MKKIKVLQVNEIDLSGRIFNGYDFIYELPKDRFIIKQAVIIKQSDDDNVVKILNSELEYEMLVHLEQFEKKHSIHNVFSITSPALTNMKEYKEADIIHFHMFHNTKLSLCSLLQIAKEKKVVISLHDPWWMTGRCVHFYQCKKWKDGCTNCKNLDTLFSFKKDNASKMWNLKKEIFSNINVDIVVSSVWMQDIVMTSPIFEKQKNVHLIPFGIDVDRFSTETHESARKKLGIKKDHIVLFLRAQKDFKGTEYVLDALKKLNIKQKITILTCGATNLLKPVSDKYNIIEFGHISNEKMIVAMNACDIFLMPSKAESFGMMALEAMACEKTCCSF